MSLQGSCQCDHTASQTWSKHALRLRASQVLSCAHVKACSPGAELGLRTARIMWPSLSSVCIPITTVCSRDIMCSGAPCGCEGQEEGHPVVGHPLQCAGGCACQRLPSITILVSGWSCRFDCGSTAFLDIVLCGLNMCPLTLAIMPQLNARGLHARVVRKKEARSHEPPSTV